MLLIYETKLSKEDAQRYKDLNYRVASIKDNPVIRAGESVGIVLDTIDRKTITLINNILYKNDSFLPTDYKSDKEGNLQRVDKKHYNKKISKLTLKYKDQVWSLTSMTDWKYNHQSETDQIKTKTTYHPIYQAYLDRLKMYRDSHKKNKRRELFKQYNVQVSEVELDNYINAFAYLYDMAVDMTDIIDKLRAYQQIQFYQDNEIPYINERVIDPEDEPMFIGKFKIEYEEPVEIISFGNEIYLDDFIYKNAGETN